MSGRLVGRAALAVPTAVLATTLVAALARATGVDLTVQGETIPVSGVAFVTAVCSVVGVGLAAALRRWAARPASTFVRVTVALTALSLVPPFLAVDDPATVATLVVLHLVPATVVIPFLAGALRGPDQNYRGSAARSAGVGGR